MKGGKKGKGLRFTAAVLTAAVLLFSPSCEAMPQAAVSQAASPVSSAAVSSAPEAMLQAAGGDALPAETVQEGIGNPAISYRMEEYHLSGESLEITVSYPQIEGEGREELNTLLRERALQTAELLEQEQTPVSAPEASSADVSSAEASSAPREQRTVLLIGGSQCYLPTDDFFSVAFTMDINDSAQQAPSKEWYTFNCDLRTGEEVTCADLFADLDGLSGALREQLEQDGVEDSLLTYLTQDRLRAGLPGVPVAFGSGFAEFGYPVPRAAGGTLTITIPLNVAAAYRSDSVLWEAIGIS